MKSVLIFIGFTLLPFTGAWANPVVFSASKPANGVVAQSDPDGTNIAANHLAFDSEQASPNVRHTWGQSFHLATAKKLGAISVQIHGSNAADSDAQLKLALFRYNAATFDADAWGTFATPFLGASTSVLHTEIFSLPTAPTNGHWMTLPLAAPVDLSAGTYGFALWLSNTAGGNTSGGNMTMVFGGTYPAGERLRIRGDTGNTLHGGDLNFVVQELNPALDDVIGTVAGAPTVDLTEGVYDIAVRSADFWNDRDNGIFTGTTDRTGDFHLECQVQSLTSPPYPWAKAGIMLRESRDADAKAAGIYLTSGRGAVFQSRKFGKGETTRVVEGSLGNAGHLRLIRKGDAFYGAASADGETWVSLGKQDWESMPGTLETGIGVAGQNNALAQAQVGEIVATDVASGTGLYEMTLLDNAGGTALRSFFQGDVLDLAHYPSGLSVRAEAASNRVKSVLFEIGGVPVATDSSAPFTLDVSALANGAQTLKTVPYDGINATGTRMDSLAVEFRVTRGSGATPPNIIYIHCDDLGYADAGFNGSQEVFTPNLDRLARSGVRCTAGSITAPQCAPSRAGMISGMYQARFGYTDNGTRRGLPEAAVAKTGPELFKELGFTNAMIGKWHIEKSAEKLANSIAANETNVLPWHRGFDYVYAMDGGSCHYFPYRADGILWLTSRNYEHRNREVMEGSSTFQLLDLPADTYQTTEFVDRSIGFIDRNKSAPFFLYLSFNAPHTPVTPRADELAANTHIANNGRRNLAASMTGVDREVGRLLDFLEAENLLEKTIIYFLSDNGGETAQNHSINDPFSGRKGDVLEGGTRVPFLISWKGQIPANRDFHSPVLSIDYIPTALRQQGRSIPDHLDGMPLLDDLQGKSNTLWDTPRFVMWRGSYQSCRMGSYKKTIQPAGSISGAVNGHFDIERNIKELAEFPALNPAVISELDALMAARVAEAANPVKQNAWFDVADVDLDIDNVRVTLSGKSDEETKPAPVSR